MAQSFTNTNVCNSFNLTIGTTMALGMLSSFRCSEVIVLNKTGQDVKINDLDKSGDHQAFLIGDGESITIRGITNSDQVSCYTTTGSGLIYCRTQYYSNSVKATH